LVFLLSSIIFSFNHTSSPEIYPLSLHDALPICDTLTIEAGTMNSFSVLTDDAFFLLVCPGTGMSGFFTDVDALGKQYLPEDALRSEEHTSELQSRENLVCRLLLEKKKKKKRRLK